MIQERPNINDEKFLPWTLEEALVLIRKVQQLIEPFRYNAALAGSVLHSGSSEHDLDIIVFPHRTHGRHDPIGMVNALREEGFTRWELRDHSVHRDQKLVYATVKDGKRIDFFFLNG